MAALGGANRLGNGAGSARPGFGALALGASRRLRGARLLVPRQRAHGQVRPFAPWRTDDTAQQRRPVGPRLGRCRPLEPRLNRLAAYHRDLVGPGRGRRTRRRRGNPRRQITAVLRRRRAPHRRNKGLRRLRPRRRLGRGRELALLKGLADVEARSPPDGAAAARVSVREPGTARARPRREAAAAARAPARVEHRMRRRLSWRSRAAREWPQTTPGDRSGARPRGHARRRARAPTKRSAALPLGVGAGSNGGRPDTIRASSARRIRIGLRFDRLPFAWRPNRQFRIVAVSHRLVFCHSVRLRLLPDHPGTLNASPRARSLQE